MKRAAALVWSAGVLTLCAAHWGLRGDMTGRIGEHLLVYTLAFVAYLVALRTARGLSPRRLQLAIGLALAWRLLLVAAPPLLSDDVFRYVWEGRIQAHGGNPYRWLDRPEAERWAALRDETWRGVNHKSYTALYPPLWQLAARAVVAVHDSVPAMKAFLVSCELLGWLLLARLLARRGLPRERLLIAAWSPLALVEIAGSGHNEAFGIFWLLLALLALESGRHARAAVFATAGFLSKLVPGLLALGWARRFRPVHAALGGAVAVVLTLPYLSAGRGLVRTLVGYSEYWRFNESLFALLDAVLAPGLAATVAAGLLLAITLLVAARDLDPPRALLLVAVAWLFLMPSVLPWYALWLLPCLVLVDAPAALAFTGTIALAYTVYPGWRGGGPWQVAWPLRIVEYGIPLLLLAVNLARSRKTRALIVFVKRPRPGEVKTRVAAEIGDENAAELYRAIAEAEIRASRPARDAYRRLFFYAPAEAAAEMATWLTGETLIPQRGENLGARMADAFETAFASGASRVAIIGSDVPWLDASRVEQAFAALDAADLVIGPCDDGGYYLLALSKPHPELFAGVAWSTPSVLAETLERARREGLRVTTLEVLSDLDSWSDVERHWPRLRPFLPPQLVASIEARLAAR